MQKYILILYGPMCCGKSTLAKIFLQNEGGVFHINVDKIKFLISDYDAGKYLGVVNQITLDLARSAVKQGFPLIVEGNVGMQKEIWKEYKKLADEHGFKFIELNFEAPLDILTKRFLARVENAKATGSRLTVTEVDQMMKRYDGYIEFKKHDIPVIVTSEKSPKEIYEWIIGRYIM